MTVSIRLAAVLAVTACLLGLALGWWIWCREPAAAPPAPEVIKQLEAIGAVPETQKAAPETKDLPRGTRVIEDVSGKGRERRTAEEQAATVKGDTAGISLEGKSPPGGCPDLLAAITPADLAVDCRSQVIEAAPGYTVARIFGDATVRLPGGKVIARGCAPGKTCDPAGREALEDVRYAHETATPVRRWDGELRAGFEMRDVVYDPHVAGQFGGSWYPPGRRVGVAADLSRDLTASRFHPPDWSVAAMAAIDVGPK